MSQTGIVKGIVKGYFFGALGVSAFHIIQTFEKLGLNDGEQYLTPFAIDGIAVLGLIMRSERWSTSTRKIGLRVQVGAGSLSLAANVFAGSSLGGRILGVMVVGLFLLSEWLGDRMETRADEIAQAEAFAQVEALAAQQAEETAKREAKNAAARARRQATKSAKHSAELQETKRIRAAERALQASAKK
jgi:hypothetical protein